MGEFDDKKVTQYLIPANVTTKFEFFPGFGWYEFKIVIIACLIGCVFFFLAGVPKKTVSEAVPITITTQGEVLPETKMEIQDKKIPYIPVLIRTFFIIVPGVAAFVVVKRDQSSGMSFLTILRNRQDYAKKQKRYLDIYGSGSEGK